MALSELLARRQAEHDRYTALGLTPVPMRLAQDFDPRAWRLCDAKPGDCVRLIDKPCAVIANGQLVGAYLDTRTSGWPLERLRGTLHALPCRKNQRVSGLHVCDRTFGYSPPSAFHNAHRADLYRDAPALCERLERAASNAADVFQQIAPETYRDQQDRLAAIRQDYRLGDTPFTSGVANKTTAMRYHADSPNLPGSWSVLLVLCEGVSGGHLNVPEWNMSFAMRDGYALLFSGQRFTHGVTPIHGDGYRYSVVWYARDGFENADSPLAELLKRRRRLAYRRKEVQ